MTHDLKIALAAAAKAAAVIKIGFAQEFATGQKADKSLVTSIDEAAERVIIDELQKHTRHAILSEESGSLPGGTDFTWVIDPIDGTTNFSRRHQPFAVSIALMHGDKPLLGVIQNPLTNECFYAENGLGAFLDGKSIQASNNTAPHKSIVFFNFGIKPDDRRSIVRVVDTLIDEFDLRTWGTTAWELCTVAKGTADAFVCVGDKLWDYAAGMCIVTEAGGCFSNWRGEPWQPDNSHILAASPAMQPVLVRHIEQLQEKIGSLA